MQPILEFTYILVIRLPSFSLLDTVADPRDLSFHFATSLSPTSESNPLQMLVPVTIVRTDTRK